MPCSSLQTDKAPLESVVKGRFTFPLPVGPMQIKDDNCRERRREIGGDLESGAESGFINYAT